MDDLRRRVLEGEVDVPAVGEVSRRLPPRIPPYVVTINGEEIAPIVDYLTSLTLSDMSL